MPAADEQQLILQAKDGNPDAFRRLVERYMKRTYDIAYNFVGSHDDAEDIAQEAFVRVHRSLGSFRGESEFSTWLHRIVTNLSINRAGEKKRQSQREMRASDVEHLPDHHGGRGESSDVQFHVEQALHELPTLQRAVVILRHLNGLSTREVSDILRCSDGTVKTHLHRGLKKMKSMLDFLKDE